MSKYSELAKRLRNAYVAWNDSCDGVPEDGGAALEAADALRELEAQVAVLEEENGHLDEERNHLRSRLGIECGCGYDKRSDICMCHLPVFDTLRAERDRLLELALRIKKAAQELHEPQKSPHERQATIVGAASLMIEMLGGE